MAQISKIQNSLLDMFWTCWPLQRCGSLLSPVYVVGRCPKPITDIHIFMGTLNLCLIFYKLYLVKTSKEKVKRERNFLSKDKIWKSQGLYAGHLHLGRCWWWWAKRHKLKIVITCSGTAVRQNMFRFQHTHTHTLTKRRLTLIQRMCCNRSPNRHNLFWVTKKTVVFLIFLMVNLYTYLWECCAKTQRINELKTKKLLKDQCGDKKGWRAHTFVCRRIIVVPTFIIFQLLSI